MKFDSKKYVSWLLCSGFFKKDKVMDVVGRDDYDSENIKLEIKMNGTEIADTTLEDLITYLHDRIKSNLEDKLGVSDIKVQTNKEAKIMVDKVFEDQLKSIYELADTLETAKSAAEDIIKQAWSN